MPTLDVLTNFSVSSSWEGITKSAGVVTVSPPLLWYDDVSTTVSAAQWCLTSFFLIQKNFLFFTSSLEISNGQALVRVVLPMLFSYPGAVQINASSSYSALFDLSHLFLISEEKIVGDF